MGTNYYLRYENKSVHIGKSSAGWKFLINILALLRFSLKIDNFKKHRKKIRETIRHIKEIKESNETKYYKSNRKESWITEINDISQKIIESILRLKGSYIYDEYDEDLKEYDWFFWRLQENCEKKDCDHFYYDCDIIYSRCDSKWGTFDIKIGNYRCSTCDDFC